MRARRLSRLAGLVLALAALALPIRAASGGYTSGGHTPGNSPSGFTTMDYDWSAPAFNVVGDTASPGSGAGSFLAP